jgi:hypothetical protein
MTCTIVRIQPATFHLHSLLSGHSAKIHVTECNNMVSTACLYIEKLLITRPS